MSKNCILCGESILEEFGKFLGTVVRSKNEKGMVEFIHVCSECQKKENWHEDALVKGA